ncbi:hypothetical protein QUF80_16405 [Desulfococcaceae bacterium HSG8]|nr:hypothetical protein [Desulfococcaceae bacterium HSG8]
MNIAMKIISGCHTGRYEFPSVFKKTEEFFRENPDCEKLIVFLGLQKDRDSYASFSDHFFCHLFPELKKDCHIYYKGRGPKLKDILSEGCITKCDEIMLATLRVLKKAMDESI